MSWDIVTVTLNADTTISRCIASVKNQKSIFYTHTILDGGSTDSTVKLVNKNQHTRLKLLSGSDGGIYDALNKVIAMTSSDFVAILHADDYFGDDMLLKAVQNLFQQDTHLKLIYCEVNYYDAEKNKITRRSEVPEISDLNHFFRSGGQLAHPGIFVRREVYEAISFNENYRISADFQFQLQCFYKLKYKFMPLHKYCVIQQTGGTSQAGIHAFWLGKKELYDIWNRHFDKSIFNSARLVSYNILRKFMMYIKTKQASDGN